MKPAGPKSNTGAIIGALDTYHLQEREDGICPYCDTYATELDPNDGCCVENKHAMPNEVTCRKARYLRAIANTQAYQRGELKVADVNPLEGFVFESDGQTVWQRLV